MLACVTIRDFSVDGIFNAWTIKMLANNCLCLIHPQMKYIRVIPFHDVFLEFLWNNYFIFIRYKIYGTPASVKITLSIFCAFKFFCKEGVFPLIAVYEVKYRGNMPSGSSLMS